jgi:hypothetical protein
MQDRSKELSRLFKQLLSSTLDDMIDALNEQYKNTGIWLNEARIQITKSNDAERFNAPILEAKAFPLGALKTSTCIKAALIKRLTENRTLGAHKTTLQISDDRWEQILSDYSAQLMGVGLRFALKRMIRQEKRLSIYWILDITEREPIRMLGTDQFQTLVVIKMENTHPEDLTKARQIWRDRGNEKYKYIPTEYNGPAEAN